MLPPTLPLCLALLAPLARPAEDHLAAVPPKPGMLLNVSDVRSVVERGKKSSWYLLFRDVLEDLGGDEALSIDAGLTEAGLPPLAELIESFQSVVLFAAPSGDEPVGTAGAVLRTAADGGPAASAFDLLEQEVRGGGTVTELEAGGGFEALVVRPETAWPFELFTSGTVGEMAVVRSATTFAVFLGDEEGSAAALATAAMAPGERSVPGVLAAARGATGGAQVELVVDVRTMLDVADPDAESGFEELMLESVRSIPWIYAGFSIGEGESFEGMLEVPVGPGTALGKLLDLAGEVPQSLFGLMPPGCFSVSAGAFDVTGAVDLIFDYMEELAPETHEQAMAGLSGMVETMGVHPIDDLIALLDGRMGSFSKDVPDLEGIDLENPASLFGTTYVLGLTDGARFSDSFDTLLEAAGVGQFLEYGDFEGNDLYDFGASGVPLLLLVTDEALVISMSRDDLKHVVDAAQGRSERSALDDAAVKKALASGGDVRGQLSVTSTPDLLKMILALLRLFAEEEEGFAPFAAIDPSLVDEHFRGTVWMTLDASSAGVRIRAVGR